jgi:hypothetical protein
MKKTLFIATVVAVTALLTACKEKQEVSFASLEEAKGTARENAMFNAQMYRQSNILYKGWDIIGRGDSTQSNSCPQGDGWATIEFVNPEKTRMIKAKCSTVSGNTGCLMTLTSRPSHSLVKTVFVLQLTVFHIHCPRLQNDCS